MAQRELRQYSAQRGYVPAVLTTLREPFYGLGLPQSLPSVLFLPARTSTCPWDTLQRDPKGSQSHQCPLLGAQRQLSQLSSGAGGRGRQAGRAASSTDESKALRVSLPSWPQSGRKDSRVKGRDGEPPHPDQGCHQTFHTALTSGAQGPSAPSNPPCAHTRREASLSLWVGPEPVGN